MMGVAAASAVPDSTSWDMRGDNGNNIYRYIMYVRVLS